MKLDAICQALAQVAPLRLAEDWDNVGLLVGDRASEVDRVMTCLTITPDVVDEAVDRHAGLIVAHHPLPFQPLKKMTSDTVTGAMLLKAVRAGIAIYSAHTAFDSAADGINQAWAEAMGVRSPSPLSAIDSEADPSIGSGRYGVLPNAIELGELVRLAAKAAQCQSVRLVGDPSHRVTKVAFACGSGGSFLAAACKHGCDAMITGEATFHVCLEARSRGIGLLLLGHYQSERFAMERLSHTLAKTLPELSVWPSEVESDPLSTIVF